MKKIVIILSILGSVVSFANGYNVYTKTGISFIGDVDKPNKVFFYNADEQKHDWEDAVLDKKFVKASTFNLEITKNLNDYVEVGAGIGYIANTQESFKYRTDGNKAKLARIKVPTYNQMPIYLTTKINFMNQNLKPYAKFDLGYSFNKKFKYHEYTPLFRGLGQEDNLLNHNEKESKGGLYIAGALGFEYNNLLVELNTKYAACDIVYDDTNLASHSVRHINSHYTVGMNIGYKFSF